MNPLPETILMTADTIGGVWNYSLELVRALSRHNISITLATMGRKLSARQWEETRKIPNLCIEESDYELEWMEDPWDSVDHAGEWLIDLEQQIKPDLIHLNNYVHGNLDWSVPVMMVGHSCVCSWWEAVKGESAPERLHLYRQRVKAGLLQADHVVGVSAHMLECLKKFYGPFPSSGVIYNASEAADFASLHQKNQLIMSMGRIWDEGKNIHTLQHVAGQLSWPVFVAGDDRGQLDQTDNFNFLGTLSGKEVTEWLGITGIYVMPARYEPFGLSILEAAYAGCALVLGNIPSLRELWQDAALYADPEDPDQLIDQIERLTKDEGFRNRMAGRARERALRTFSTTTFGEQYVNIYQHLLVQRQNQTEKKNSSVLTSTLPHDTTT